MKKEIKKRKTIIKAPMIITRECSDEVRQEVLNVLSSTQFNKISIPLYSIRNILFEDESDNTKNITVGYIRGYDSETNEFTVVIYDGFKDKITKFENPAIEIVFGIYNNELTVISKLNIIPQ